MNRSFAVEGSIFAPSYYCDHDVAASRDWVVTAGAFLKGELMVWYIEYVSSLGEAAGRIEMGGRYHESVCISYIRSATESRSRQT